MGRTHAVRSDCVDAFLILLMRICDPIGSDMTKKSLRAFAFLVLLSLPTFGQEKIMVCKNIESVFTDTGDSRDGNQMSRIQGPPGKKGVPGSQGPPGVPGIQGLPGTPATMDYDRISKIIEEKIRLKLEELSSKVEMLQQNVTGLSKTADQRCLEKSGLFYQGKCYFTPYISYSSGINYEEAVQECLNEGAAIAEIHSRIQQSAVENFFRKEVPSSRSSVQLWTGMKYLSTKKNLRYRCGKEVASSQLEWHRGYPSRIHENVALDIDRVNVQSATEGFFNRPGTEKKVGALCEL